MIRILITSVLFLLCLNSCKIEADGAGRTIKGSFTHQGIERSFEIYIPSNYDEDQSSPLLIMLHGRYGTGKASKQQSGMNVIADQKGFIVVYPDGYKNSWNDGREFGPAFENSIDDVGFIDKMLDYLISKHKINEKKVYVAGMSNGGFMSMRLGCELTHRFAAVGSVAATMAVSPENWCTPSREIPVILIGGVDDPIIPYTGGAVSSGSFCVGFEDTYNYWKQNANCTMVETSELWSDQFPDDGTQISKRSYVSCDNNTQVHLYEVLGGGHTWPGGNEVFNENTVGKLSLEMNASAVIAEFFLQFSLD